jgi:hypothetical protein
MKTKVLIASLLVACGSPSPDPIWSVRHTGTLHSTRRGFTSASSAVHNPTSKARSLTVHLGGECEQLFLHVHDGEKTLFDGRSCTPMRFTAPARATLTSTISGHPHTRYDLALALE